MDPKNKVVLVTGGAVRLGRAICLELARQGSRIFCQFHSSDKAARSLKQEIEKDGGNIEIFGIDLTAADAPAKLLKKVIEVYDTIDILVNNSAIFYPTTIGRVTEEDWNNFHELNLKAAFFLSQEAGMIMKKKGQGKIISIGDISWISPWPDFLPYTLTKAGINTMTRGLAKALAPEVLVNCINPGPVLIPEDYSAEQRQKAVKKTVLKREGRAADIAKTILFLIESDYITGAAIPVDGGRHLG